MSASSDRVTLPWQCRRSHCHHLFVREHESEVSWSRRAHRRRLSLEPFSKLQKPSSYWNTSRVFCAFTEKRFCDSIVPQTVTLLFNKRFINLMNFYGSLWFCGCCCFCSWDRWSPWFVQSLLAHLLPVASSYRYSSLFAFFRFKRALFESLTWVREEVERTRKVADSSR